MKIDVSRSIDRNRTDFTVEVLTPMFLGGADRNAELRTPPFKNALRYWWRITQGNEAPDTLGDKEQKLFGGVADKATRSRVAVVVTGDVKTDKENNSIGKKHNPEAGRPVSLAAYLGMGPVDFSGRYLKKKILPSERFSLSVSFPKANREALLDTLSLFKAFGSLGARSRNGWGSFDLKPKNHGISLLPRKTLFEKFGRDLDSIFADPKKYPYALGKSAGQPLFWKIANGNRWQDVMKIAGESYMDLRQKVLPFPKDKPGGVQERHILGYPVTRHPVDEWKKNGDRMPSQLRIIIRKMGDGYGVYFFHLPHLIPQTWSFRPATEPEVWEKVHGYLDENFERTV